MSKKIIKNAVLYLGNCLEVMKDIPNNSIDSVVTDPPYGLKFMGNKWDYDVPAVDVWKAALRILKPGGHLLSFGGARTYHRMVVNIEDAGFEIRDQIMWIYGTGFPKSLDISKAIDKVAKSKRKVVSEKPAYGIGGGSTFRGHADGAVARITISEHKYAKESDGWGTALKPAHEPICVARKPLIGTVANNFLQYGTGALNIDECRVELNEPDTKGRWPANVIHDGSPEVEEEFAKYGKGRARGNISPTKRNKSEGVTGWGVGKSGPIDSGDSGSASRFFYCAKASKSERNAGLEDFKQRSPGEMTGRKEGSAGLTPGAGAGRTGGSKNYHPTVKPLALMRYLVRLVTPHGGTILDHYMGSGSTGVAIGKEDVKFIGIEKDKEYFEIACKRIKHAQSHKEE